MLSARLTQSIAKQTRGLKTSAIRRSDDGHSHRLFNPPYNGRTIKLIWGTILGAGMGAIALATCYQQKKGGFWFKKKAE